MPLFALAHADWAVRTDRDPEPPRAAAASWLSRPSRCGTGDRVLTSRLREINDTRGLILRQKVSVRRSPMTVRLTSPGQGETFASGPVRFRILEDGGGVEARFGVAECVLGPGWPGPPQHVHRAHDETFYVVSGSVTFTSRSEELLAEAGSLVTVP